MRHRRGAEAASAISSCARAESQHPTRQPAEHRAHYDLGNDFYRLARPRHDLFVRALPSPVETLEEAQRVKLERVFELLGLAAATGAGDRLRLGRAGRP